MIVAICIKTTLILTGIITFILALLNLSKRTTTPMFSSIWIIFSAVLILTGIFIEPYNWSNVIGIPTIILFGILSLAAIIFLWYLTKKIDELQHKFNESVIQLTLLNNKNQELEQRVSNLSAQMKNHQKQNYYEETRNKDILFVNNTLSAGGAEIALLDQLEYYATNNNVYLYIMTGMGELIKKIPPNIKILNEHFDSESVLTNDGRKKLVKKVVSAEVGSFTGIKLAGYNFRALANMIRKGKIQSEKLAWRAIAETTPVIPYEFDLAIAFTEGASTYYVAEKVAAKKKVAWVHTNFVRAGYTKQLDKDSYNYFNEIYTISNKTREAFLTIHPECLNKISVKNLLIPQNKIEKLSKQAMEKPVWNLIDNNTIRILTVSRLVKLKSYENMILAAKILKDKGYKFIWTALGEGEERNNLEQLITRNNLNSNFILLGHVDNPYPYYRNCNIYVHATKYEGKSIAVKEAKSLGCPIVLSKTDGNIGQIEDNFSGLYCDTKADDIANKIEYLINNKEIAKNFGLNAKNSEI